MNNYTVEYYQYLKRKTISYLIISILIIVFGIAFTLLTGLFINDKNVLIFKLVDSIVLSISLVAFLYILIELFSSSKNRLKFIYQLLAVSRYQGKVQVLKISNITLIRKGIYGYEVTVVDENTKEAIYYTEDISNLDIDDILNVTIANNFIMEYKKENEHE